MFDYHNICFVSVSIYYKPVILVKESKEKKHGKLGKSLLKNPRNVSFQYIVCVARILLLHFMWSRAKI